MPAARFGKPQAQIHPPESRIQILPTLTACFRGAPRGVGGAALHLIDALHPPPYRSLHDCRGTVRAALVKPARSDAQSISKLLLQTAAAARDRIEHLLSGTHDQFGRRGRSWRTQIGDKICDGEVRLMADSRDDGNCRTGNGSRHTFIIEGPEIL
jgi:hypothetical protein